MTATWLCLVILDELNDEFLHDLVAGIYRFVPEADIAWYDSGNSATSPPQGVVRLPCSRPLRYAKVTPFFLDLLEWVADSDYRCVVNVETDMAFVRDGFAQFVAQRIQTGDHIAAHYRRHIPTTSRWRPYRSLKHELPELTAILGVDSTHACFSPGQTFSRRYARAVVGAAFYPRLRSFVAANQAPHASFSLQEVLLPTLVDVVGMRTVPYPQPAERCNRYRPYHAAASVRRAAADARVHFVHPVRRSPHDGGRLAARELLHPT